MVLEKGAQMIIYPNFFETIELGFYNDNSTTGIFLDVEKTFDQVWYDRFHSKLTSVGLNRKLTRWISNFLYQRKLIISIKDQMSDSITPIHGVPQGSSLFPILFIFYFSDISQSNITTLELSQFADDITIWAQSPGICSITLRF